MLRILSLAAMVCLGIGSPEARADDARDAEIQAELLAQEREPSRAFLIPKKWTDDGAQADEEEGSLFFSDDLIASQGFAAAKRQVRRRLLTLTLQDGQAVEPESFNEDIHHWKLSEMASLGLETGSLAVSPWSGDYWALYLGMIARRFADPGFPSSKDWKTNSDSSPPAWSLPPWSTSRRRRSTICSWATRTRASRVTRFAPARPITTATGRSPDGWASVTGGRPPLTERTVPPAA